MCRERRNEEVVAGECCWARLRRARIEVERGAAIVLDDRLTEGRNGGIKGLRGRSDISREREKEGKTRMSDIK
jgi:hypothetical protein